MAAIVADENADDDDDDDDDDDYDNYDNRDELDLNNYADRTNRARKQIQILTTAREQQQKLEPQQAEIYKSNANGMICQNSKFTKYNAAATTAAAAAAAVGLPVGKCKYYKEHEEQQQQQSQRQEEIYQHECHYYNFSNEPISRNDANNQKLVFATNEQECEQINQIINQIIYFILHHIRLQWNYFKNTTLPLRFLRLRLLLLLLLLLLLEASVIHYIVLRSLILILLLLLLLILLLLLLNRLHIFYVECTKEINHQSNVLSNLIKVIFITTITTTTTTTIINLYICEIFSRLSNPLKYNKQKNTEHSQQIHHMTMGFIQMTIIIYFIVNMLSTGISSNSNTGIYIIFTYGLMRCHWRWHWQYRRYVNSMMMALPGMKCELYRRGQRRRQRQRQRQQQQQLLLLQLQLHRLQQQGICIIRLIKKILLLKRFLQQAKLLQIPKHTIQFVKQQAQWGPLWHCKRSIKLCSHFAHYFPTISILKTLTVAANYSSFESAGKIMMMIQTNSRWQVNQQLQLHSVSIAKSGEFMKFIKYISFCIGYIKQWLAYCCYHRHQHYWWLQRRRRRRRRRRRFQLQCFSESIAVKWKRLCYKYCHCQQKKQQQQQQQQQQRYYLPFHTRSLILILLISTLWHGTECFHSTTTITTSSNGSGSASSSSGNSATATTTSTTTNTTTTSNSSSTGSSSSSSSSSNTMKLSPNTVRTKYGLLRGIVVRSSPLVEAYLGIPYASPPVGSLRFMPPITPSTWKNVHNADRFSPVCPQTVPIPPNGPEALLEVPRARLAQLRRLLPLLKNQSEDCLYLNIYVPYENRRYRRSSASSSSTGRTSTSSSSSAEQMDSTNKLPAILFIHGESYEWNSGNPYDGTELAAHGKVIVVTINFRLGIFGFLKTGGKESAQGNFGLMDLVAGLHWLKENLPAFGGDPHNIVLLGHGSGAALANILMVSPVASDLIQRTILVSGSALSPWAIQKNPLFVKRRVAEQTGCHGDMLYDDLAPCLRTKSVSDLLAVKIDHPRFLAGFAPFVDGTVISPHTDPIGELTLPLGSAIVSTSGIEFANFPKRDLIFCLTSVESYLDLSAQDLEFGFNETRRDRILRTFVRNNFHYHLNEIFAVLKNEYTDWEKTIRNPLSSRDATLSFLSDGHTASALIKLGFMHSLRGGRSYFLHFKHKTIEEEFPQRTGSVRGEDVPFWLGLPVSPLFPHNYTTQEKQISHLMLRYLANFAKTGNPNHSTQMPSSPNVIGIISGSSSLPGRRRQYVDHSNNNYNNNGGGVDSGDSEEISPDLIDHEKLKRSTYKKEKSFVNRTITKIAAQEEVIAAAREQALQLAVIYNQRRSNAMHEKRSYYKRRLRSNDANSNGNGDGLWYADINSAAGGAAAADHLPFWDAYDVVNQLYLELGKKAEIQSHYRGHKLSMWLNLIPQLHKHYNINDPSMRHHQFINDLRSRDLYEGVVRPQMQTKPIDDDDDDDDSDGRDDDRPKVTKATLPIKLLNATVNGTTNNSVTTECDLIDTGATAAPPSSSISSSSAYPPVNRSQMTTASSGQFVNAEVSFESNSIRTFLFIGIGILLLILNAVLFASNYYQCEKRIRDNKTKEQLQDNNLNKNTASILKLNTIGDDIGAGEGDDGNGGIAGCGYKKSVFFGEYNCYDEKTLQQTTKLQLKDGEKVIIELPQTSHCMVGGLGMGSCSTNTLDLLKTQINNSVGGGGGGGAAAAAVGGPPFDPAYSQLIMTEQTDIHLQPINNIEMVTYKKLAQPTPSIVTNVMETGNVMGSAVDTSLRRTSSFIGSPPAMTQFDYAVQSSDQMSFKAIEDAVKASSSKSNTTNNHNHGINDNDDDDDDDDEDDDIPEPPPPPRSFLQQQQQTSSGGGGGILRQPGGGSGNVANGTQSGAGTNSGSGVAGGKKRVHIQEISV